LIKEAEMFLKSHPDEQLEKEIDRIDEIKGDSDIQKETYKTFKQRYQRQVHLNAQIELHLSK